MSSFVMMIAYVSVDSKGYLDNLSRCIMTLINYHRSNEIYQRITDINRSLRLFKRERKKSKKEQSYLQLLCQLLPLLKRFSCHFCWYFWHIFLKQTLVNAIMHKLELAKIFCYICMSASPIKEYHRIWYHRGISIM